LTGRPGRQTPAAIAALAVLVSCSIRCGFVTGIMPDALFYDAAITYTLGHNEGSALDPLGP